MLSFYALFSFILNFRVPWLLNIHYVYLRLTFFLKLSVCSLFFSSLYFSPSPSLTKNACLLKVYNYPHPNLAFKKIFRFKNRCMLLGIVHTCGWTRKCIILFIYRTYPVNANIFKEFVVKSSRPLSASCWIVSFAQFQKIGFVLLTKGWAAWTLVLKFAGNFFYNFKNMHIKIWIESSFYSFFVLFFWKKDQRLG